MAVEEYHRALVAHLLQPCFQNIQCMLELLPEQSFSLQSEKEIEHRYECEDIEILYSENLKLKSTTFSSLILWSTDGKYNEYLLWVTSHFRVIELKSSARGTLFYHIRKLVIPLELSTLPNIQA